MWCLRNFGLALIILLAQQTGSLFSFRALVIRRNGAQDLQDYIIRYSRYAMYSSNPVTDIDQSRNMLTTQNISLSQAEDIVGGDDSTDCFDEAVIFVRAGSGGHGSNTFKFGKGRQHNQPMGGNGGDGGTL